MDIKTIRFHRRSQFLVIKLSFEGNGLFNSVCYNANDSYG